MWRVHTEGTIRHVFPDDEIHDTDTLDCYCNAKSQVCENGIVSITHNSADGREYIERLIASAGDSIN